MSAPKLRLIAADFFERPVKLRLPFRFGVVTLTEAPQIFVRARIKLADGREGEGVSAELLAPKWFDKSPDLTNGQNFDQLRASLAAARLALLTVGSGTPFGLSAAVDGELHKTLAESGLNGLIASFGLALIDRAIIDALGGLEALQERRHVELPQVGLPARGGNAGHIGPHRFIEGQAKGAAERVDDRAVDQREPERRDQAVKT